MSYERKTNNNSKSLKTNKTLKNMSVAQFKAFLKTAGLKVKPHQIDAIQWCINRENDVDCYKRGGVLADEMGLGKTIVMLGLTQINQGDKPTLIVVPPALLEQWKSVIINFTGMKPWSKDNLDAKFIVYHGYTACGDHGVEDIDNVVEYLQSCKIILTTYGMMATRKGIAPFPVKIKEEDNSHWSKSKDSRLWMVKYHRIIYDEAHHMRNPRSRKFAGAVILQDPKRSIGTTSGFKTDEQYASEAAKKGDCDCSICHDPLSHRLKKTKCGHIYHAHCIDRWANNGHNSCPLCRKPLQFLPVEHQQNNCKECHPIKWYVTGTPIQNYKKDLVSLLVLLGLRSMGSLKETASKYLLRRTKIDAGIKLPPLSMETLQVNPTCKNELELAKLIHNKLSFSGLMEKIENCRTIEELTALVKLIEGESVFPLFIAARQCAVYPQLIVDKMRFKLSLFDQFEGKELDRLRKVLNKIHTKSSKIDAVIKKIEECKDEGRKIIFAHYRKEIDQYKKRLLEKNFQIAILDGRTKSRERKNILEDKVKPDVLIVQIQSGCEGLNLQKYSQIYFTSPSWNPATDDQAVARAHRIGQLNKVKIFKFIYNGIGKNCYTLDQYCKAIQDQKRIIAKEILG